MGTIRGGSLIIRRCPARTVVSFAAAWGAIPGPGLGQLGLGLADRLLGQRRPQTGEGLLHIETGVPDLHDGHGGEIPHRGAVGGRGRNRHATPVLWGETVVAPGYDHTGRQPLHVPLERARQRLVEVVQIEHHPPLGRAERSEVGQVSVTAQLHP
jgi:hypothetical protein